MSDQESVFSSSSSDKTNSSATYANDKPKEEDDSTVKNEYNFNKMYDSKQSILEHEDDDEFLLNMSEEAIKNNDVDTILVLSYYGNQSVMENLINHLDNGDLKENLAQAIIDGQNLPFEEQTRLELDTPAPKLS